MSDGVSDLENKYVVRLWDWYDGWIDCWDLKPCSHEEATAYWNSKTNNGTIHHNEKYVRSHYYAIFPANTRMIYTPESLGR